MLYLEDRILYNKNFHLLILILITYHCKSSFNTTRLYVFPIFHLIQNYAHITYLLCISEYGMGNEVSIYGDTYSYGILLLEMFTGKKPTDNIFQDSLNLHEFVKAALPEQVIDIIDPILLSEREGENRVNDINCNESQNGSLKRLECLIFILEIGVACSVEFPRERMTMGAVIIELHSIRKEFLGTNIHRQRFQATGKFCLS